MSDIVFPERVGHWIEPSEPTTIGHVLPEHGPIHADLGGTVERDRSTIERRVASCEGALRESARTPSTSRKA